jgi:steroid 5-alpha reductase family enzyme
LKTQTGKAYWLVSFSGIHLFPTLLVFGGCIPLLSSLGHHAGSIGLIDMVAIILTIVAILIESIADNQLREFRLNNTDKEKVLANGLWAYSRHPNYFGEILFWWGLFVFSLGESIDNWWMGVGALSITLLFFFISVPMIDKRMKERRPAYLAHCKRVPAILFWFPKK